MSEETDDSQKTEEPTQRRLEQAREKGQVVNSREVSTWMMLFAAALAIYLLVPSMGADFIDTLTPFIAHPHDIPIDSVSVRSVLVELFLKTFLAMAFFALLMIIAALAGNGMQSGILFSSNNIQPKFERISLFKGIKRLFSMKSVVEFLKGLAKLAIIGGVLYTLLKPVIMNSPLMVDADVVLMGGSIQEIVMEMLSTVLSVLFMIAALDFLYQKLSFMKSMRMSKQEMKDEYKQTEGDPVIKGKLRQLRQQRLKKRMMATVPEASVIITNPTHYSIALKYDKTSIGAPIVLAKGMDFIALKIREIAKEHEIPIVENPPLARALYADCEIDEEISFEHYKAVAQVISYIMKLKKRK